MLKFVRKAIWLPSNPLVLDYFLPGGNIPHFVGETVN